MQPNEPIYLMDCNGNVVACDAAALMACFCAYPTYQDWAWPSRNLPADESRKGGKRDAAK